MPVCSTCGAPDHLRCNCAQTPYCDQCAGNDNCNSSTDSACVFYHPDYPNQTTPPSHLIYLSLPNGSSAETIFEAIDAKFGALAHDPIIPVDTQTVDLTVGADGRTLSADVKVSPDSGNLIAIHTNGLFVANPNPNYLVKVDANDAPDYLFNQMVGDTNGCITIDVLNQSGLVTIRPNLDFECFANSLCAANLGVKEEIANCLINAGLQILDTNSIDLNLTTATPNVLSANAKISSTAGNVLVINSDGLYVPTPSSSGLTTANNGLSVSGGTTVQLGGALIHNTNINMGNAFNLSFSNNPLIYVGEGSPVGTAVFQVENTNYSSGRLQAGNFSTVANFGANGITNLFGVVTISGGAQTDTINSLKSAIQGEMRINATGTVTLNSSGDGYGGIIGVMFKENSGNVSSGNIISAGTFVSFAADSGNVDSWAAIRARGLQTADTGGPYTGTVVNYYGLYVDDISTSDYGGHVTNKYAIFEAGTTSLNVFSTTPTITSDIRLKENVNNYTKGLQEIDNLRTVTFNYKGNPTTDVRVGVIAQEVESVIPEAIKTLPINDLDDCKLVQNDIIFLTMLNAIKELSARVKALESK